MSKFKPVFLTGAVLLLSSVILNPAVWADGTKKKSTLRLQSTSFKDGGMIPAKYASCDGQNISPELSWHGVPPKTKDFVLIVEDPDAPTQTWVHWVIYNIPAKPTDPTSNSYELVENYPRDEESASGILQGVNDFKKIGYDGPCPPSGMHRYYFKLWALDGPVHLPAGESSYQLQKAMAKHILGFTQIMGLYGK
jgi:Raf kinase inhibitor-like YbhB/YbcL family protein